jgi:hypothetical protein
MSGFTCPQCGAEYESAQDSCAQRFSALLALDHSRQEPWGSRHGSAFAAYTLQHPMVQSRMVLERCWTMLQRIYVSGDDPQFVARTLRDVENGRPHQWTVPPLPADAASPRRFRVTIADLGAFDAERYPGQLEKWCRATLEAVSASNMKTWDADFANGAD